jgi:hypothetical protein
LHDQEVKRIFGRVKVLWRRKCKKSKAEAIYNHKLENYVK